MLLKIGIFLLSLFLIFVGIQETYKGWKEPEPTRTTVADYLASDKSKEWVVLTDARINLLKSVTRSKQKEGKPPKLVELFIPIESTESDDDDDKVHFVLKTDAEELLSFARRLEAMPEEKMLQFLIENRDKLVREGALSGRLKEKKKGSNKEGYQRIENLANKFYVLDHNAEMSSGVGFGMLVFGLFLFLVFIYLMRRNKQ